MLQSRRERIGGKYRETSRSICLTDVDNTLKRKVWMKRNFSAYPKETGADQPKPAVELHV